MDRFKDKSFLSLMKYLPKRYLSQLTGRAMKWHGPPAFQQMALKAFAKAYDINLSEAERPLEEYRSLNDLFTRKLKPGARPLGGDLIHPADGLVISSGVVQQGQILQVKGLNYDLSRFLADAELAQRLEGGTYWTLYLSPRDYHRVHFPVSGQLESVRRIQGELWPVNAAFYRNFANLFVENERVVMSVKTTENKAAALVMVGATNVGHIEVPLEEQPSQPVTVGDEAGVFNFGSTVVTLLEKGLAAPPPVEEKVVVGQVVSPAT